MPRRSAGWPGGFRVVPPLATGHLHWASGFVSFWAEDEETMERDPAAPSPPPALPPGAPLR